MKCSFINWYYGRDDRDYYPIGDNMLQVKLIEPYQRKTTCQYDHCFQYAYYAIYLENKNIKLCTHHIEDLAVQLCEYGFVRRAVKPVIDEKGI